MKSIYWNIFFLSFMLSTHAASNLSLAEAEQKALTHSDQLQAVSWDTRTAESQQNAAFSLLFPRIAFQGSYSYISTLPSLSFEPGRVQTFGSNNNYNIGPTLQYTLWDTLSSIKSYQALSKLSQSKQEVERQAHIQLLATVRAAYIQVQLAQEEISLVKASLQLAQSQQRDMLIRLKAGAATQLDKVLSSRQVLGYELQVQQQEVRLDTAWKDLSALLGETPESLETLEQSTQYLSQFQINSFSEEHPGIQSLRLFSESLEKSANAQTAKLFPTLQITASTSFTYPNGPIQEYINQNILGLSLSLPLYLGDPTWNLAESKQRESKAAWHRMRQLKTDLERDFDKATHTLQKLLEQKKLADEDIKSSEQAAKLYYDSYKAGRINFTEVQSANTQALQSQVNSARLDAQILAQRVILIALSKQEVSHENN